MRKALGIVVVLTLSFVLRLNAQDWVEGMQDPSVNFYEVQRDFEEFWSGKEIEKGKGYKQFRRWEHFTQERVYPTGERPSPSLWHEAVQQTRQMSTGFSELGDWKPMGPYNGNAIDGIGRLNCIAFDPNNPNTLYVGSPSGGFWISNDAGMTWATTSDELTNLGVSAIVVDPSNSNHIYIATGDRDAGDAYSHGVMESMDAGQTWQSRNNGLGHNVQNAPRSTGLYINPNIPSELVLTTRSGIFKTYDGGLNWSNVQGGAFQALEQKSGNPNVLFATTTPSSRMYMSTDAGDTWTMLNPATSGLPTNARRMEMAVTPADTNYIYAIASGSDNGLLGVYRSTDGGLNWTLRSSSPNLLGWSSTGGDSGGQGWYDLAIAVAPDNRNEVYTGGVNIWKSNNGGSSWNLNAHWFGGGGAPYVHADIHALEFQPSTNTLYSCSDGGLNITNNGGNSWPERQNGMNITQYYKISTSDADSVQILGGAQDNGTHRRNLNRFWNRVNGGDGMDNAIDHSNPLVMYVSSQYGNFLKSTNGGGNFFASFDQNNTLPMGNGAWVTPIELDPNNSSTVYIGYGALYKSTNQGVTFSNVSGNLASGTNNIELIYVPKANSNHVYVGINASLRKSVNGGQTFSLIPTPGTGTLTSVAVDDQDENHFWITRSGYTMGQKVFETTDGGISWLNISDNLPNLPVNCILYNDTAMDGIYVGTDVGVYYRDKTLSQWLPFMNGLPNVIVRDLEYQPLSDKIRAGTYGRGAWESPSYAGELLAPIAEIAPISSPCNTGEIIQLRSRSLNNPTNYRWSINPSTYSFQNNSTDTSESPHVSFSAKGWYNVSLYVENINGADSITEYAAFRVGGLPLPYSEDFNATDSLGDWTVDNPDMVPGLGWQQVNVLGPQGTPTRAARMDLYAYSLSGLAGRQDHLISPALDFGTHQNIHMTFDHAYARRSNNSFDTLIVSISLDCGQSWTEVDRRVTGLLDGLETRSIVTSPFIPSSASHWCGQPSFASCSNIDLSGFDGISGVKVRLTTVSNGGNRLFIDNINIDGDPATPPMADFTSANTGCANYDINFFNLTAGAVDSIYWSFPGGIPANSNDASPSVSYATPGNYSVELRAYNALGGDTAIKTNHIQIQPNTDVQISIQINGGLCAGSDVDLFLLETGVGIGSSYEWFVNGVAQGIDDSTAVISGLQNGDLVYAEVASTSSCAWPQLARSDSLIISLNTPPSVSAAQLAPICQDDGPVLLSFGQPAGGYYTGPGVVNDTLYPSQAGSGVKIMRYTLVDSNGCSAGVNRSVQIASAPVFSISNSRICENDASFSPSWVQPSGGLYIFNGDTVQSIDATILTSGNTYPISYYYQNAACDSIVDFTFDVVGAPSQPLILTSNDTLRSSIIGDSYRWFKDGLRITGATSIDYFPTQSGYYQVEVSNANNCSNLSDSLSIQTSFGLSDQLTSEFKVYPNPNNGSFQISLPSWAQGELEVISLTGQRLAEKSVTGGQLEYSFSLELPKGVYIIRFKGSSLNRSLQMIVE
jgi:PKD repeat protein/photosystem II stability/assembly factor-like uncharacterized protein